MTEQEYEAIRQASADAGARSVSEFGRNALLESARPTHTDSTRDASAAPACSCELDVRLTRVEMELTQVCDELYAHLNNAAASSE